MSRGFLAHQLVEVEDELASCANFADQLSLEIGEHSDEIHWDKAAALPADAWLKEIRSLQWKLDRAEGLLRAYNLQLAANKGEHYDDASTR
jgi:hypothetical protein